MNKKKQERAIVLFFISGIVAVLSLLFLCALLGATSGDVPIWSGRGLVIMFFTGVAELLLHLGIYHKDVENVKNSLWTKIFLACTMIYICGIWVGCGVFLRQFGINGSVAPIWSNAGTGICYWCALMGWCAGYIMRKID